MANRKNNKEFYECFSYKQYKYLIAMGFTPEYSNTHRRTGKRFWVYRKTVQFELALKAWSVIKSGSYIENKKVATSNSY
ncbi:hypothetical protein IRY55_02490 [Savagea sp. SN6]|uniref:Uncharacterized protein n=1 Tax=Savagea serpentis TaxID=2785297 RepID=A0A8J7G8P9_9BACL|nr:hypothetical protein [Savagea serpentis]MBF4500219.1 hypothetical protein [Savagea serpentis]